MILIFGGAYQGKLEYAWKQFGDGSLWDCREHPGSDPDLSSDVICGLEAFVGACAEAGTEAADWFMQRREQWQDKVLIIRDISQGIVPMDAEERARREMNGRLMIRLAAEAEEVHRVFCGIGKRIK